MVINVYVAGDGQGIASNGNDEIWRPVRLHSLDESANEEDRRINESLRTLRGLLNKLSPRNFSRVVDKFQSLLNANPAFLDQTVALLVDKAITEPLFSKWYVEMLCAVSAEIVNDEIEDSIPYRTRVLFIEKLISIFDNLKNSDLDVENREISVIGTADRQEQLNETEFRHIRKTIGVGRVLAESFIVGILPLGFLNRCIETLLSSPKEISLMCLSKLITTVGRTFEFHLDDVEINKYFLEIGRILESSTLSTKSRFMMLNLVQYKENSWTSRTESKNLEVVGQLLRLLLEFYGTKSVSSSDTSTESDFSIETKEALYINKIYNKFTQCPRNLASVINLFNELNTTEKSKLVRLFITCVTKGDIYPEDCGKLFTCLVQSGNLTIHDIILGMKTVIHGYHKQLIFADQHIWIRLKEIFQPLLAEGAFSLSDLEDDGDIQKAREIEEQMKKKQPKKKLMSESQEPKLSWRRGLPVTNKLKNVMKKGNETNNKLSESEESNHEKVADGISLPTT